MSEKKLYTIEEALGVIPMSKAGIYKACAEKKIPSVRVGKRVSCENLWKGGNFMRKRILGTHIGGPRAGMVIIPGVNTRQARRWMKKLYRPGMSIYELADQAYRSGATDSMEQAISLAAEIVYG